MTHRQLWALPLCLIVGCTGGGTGEIVPTNPATQPLIEEPDLYRLVGDVLYVQNGATGLNILDVSKPSQPMLIGRVPVTGGAGAELFVQPADLAVILLKEATSDCRPLPGVRSTLAAGSEVALVDASIRSTPRLLGRHCLPGRLVAARTVGPILYAVTTSTTTRASRSTSYAFAIDLADPTAPSIVGEMDFPGASTEILLTEERLVVAATATTGSATRVQLVAIDPMGSLRQQGAITVVGVPQGRFHMDLRGTQFRIVTFETTGSRLSIVDLSDPSDLKLLGSLANIGRGEQLYATRFDGDLAYVVSFGPSVRGIAQDPLWVVSLQDPTRPTIVGSLEIPGWSDFLFPRGHRLIAVGRAADLHSVGLSLFDVSDPKNPRSLQQMQVGQNSTSEANIDHRGVTLLENLSPGGRPLLVIPYGSATRTHDRYNRVVCSVTNQLELIDIDGDAFIPRSTIDLRGTVRRTLPIGDRLYALSDYQVNALDVTDRDRPLIAASLTVGTDDSLMAAARETCLATTPLWGEAACSLGRNGRSSFDSVALIALALLFLRLRTQRRWSPLAVGNPLAILALLLCAGVAQADGQIDPPARSRTTVASESQERVPLLAQALSFAEQAPPIGGFGYHTEERRRLPLLAAGLSIFGGSWLLTGTVGYIAGEGLLTIPIVGPIAYIAKYAERFNCTTANPETVILSCPSEGSGDRMLYAWLAFDALVQAGGLALAAVGYFTRTKVLILDSRVAITPTIGPNGAGVFASARF